MHNAVHRPRRGNGASRAAHATKRGGARGRVWSAAAGKDATVVGVGGQARRSVCCRRPFLRGDPTQILRGNGRVPVSRLRGRRISRLAGASVAPCQRSQTRSVARPCRFRRASLFGACLAGASERVAAVRGSRSPRRQARRRRRRLESTHDARIGLVRQCTTLRTRPGNLAPTTLGPDVPAQGLSRSQGNADRTALRCLGRSSALLGAGGRGFWQRGRCRREIRSPYPIRANSLSTIEKRVPTALAAPKTYRSPPTASAGGRGLPRLRRPDDSSSVRRASAETCASSMPADLDGRPRLETIVEKRDHRSCRGCGAIVSRAHRTVSLASRVPWKRDAPVDARSTSRVVQRGQRFPTPGEHRGLLHRAQAALRAPSAPPR